MTPCPALAPAPASSPRATERKSDRALAPEESTPSSIAAKIRLDGSVCFRVLGRSMYPWIRSGDLVFVRPFMLEQAKQGDVILFKRDDRLFVHRVVRHGTNDAGLITKGDALDGEDAPVSRAEYLGRVIRIHRNDHHIDMESLGQRFLGRLLARVSRASFVWYRPMRSVKRLLFS
jgi:signal peptidase I